MAGTDQHHKKKLADFFRGSWGEQKIFLSSFSLLLIRSMGRFIGKVLHHFALDHLCLLRVGIELELEPGHALVGEKNLCQNVFLRMIF